MPHRVNLRQVEAFKAVIEYGTVSRAAEMMSVSQPAMSKLIAHLEDDTGLRLFDRIGGRLVPTPRGMRLYEEIDRIFAGIRQVENAIDTIRRDEQRRLLIGVMPALSRSFIQQVTTRFLARQPDVFCSIQSRSSQWIMNGLSTRKLDVGLVIAPIDNPYIVAEPMMDLPVVCIMPPGHPLATKDVIVPADLNRVPFISFDPESHTSQRIASVLNAHDIDIDIAMIADIAPMLSEFVAAGAGVSLVHPLIVSGMRDRVVIRRFAPSIQLDFQICRIRDSRNSRMAEAYLSVVRETAAAISREILLDL